VVVVVPDQELVVVVVVVIQAGMIHTGSLLTLDVVREPEEQDGADRKEGPAPVR
jgi:hypothetical protein